MKTVSIASTSMPVSPTPSPPGVTSPSRRFVSGTRPPIGVKLSWNTFTDPFDEPVVAPAHVPEAEGPKRTSLPSMLPPGWVALTVCVTPTRFSCGLPCDSKPTATPIETVISKNIDPKITQPNRLLFTRTPSAYVAANGIMMRKNISIMFVKPFGLSNGCAEFVLKKPPPFVPSCLIAIWLAAGPPGIVCVPPATVVTVCRRVEVLDHALAHEHDARRRTRSGGGCAGSCG